VTDKKPELTLRALASGVVLGALLTPCNIYSGLKIGWSFNMSIIALLLALAAWRLLAKLPFVRDWDIHESNISQTTASSAASIISGGLVAPIPAYTLLTGEQLATWPMIAWVFSVSLLGIWVAWYLRPMLIVRSALRFPAGMATLETMRDVFSHGREAVRRVTVLTISALLSGGVKWLHEFVRPLPHWAPSASGKQLTLALDPSLLLLGFGAIIGIRTGVSLLIGALLAWALLAPGLLEAGAVVVPADGGSLFGPLVEWLIWPGVTLMVSATMTVLLVRFMSLPGRRAILSHGAPWRAHPVAVAGFLLSVLLSVLLQMVLFDISLPMALLAIPLALMLATVAARVVGETGIPPIGAIGKVSQLSFGVAAPGNEVTNLMTANVAGGAAGQSADLLNDFKVGHGIGASPLKQAIAQFFGIVTGSVVGVWIYVQLVPDPAAMLMTVEWPAPAVATWKAVAEALSQGFESIPMDARMAMLPSAAVGIALGLLECRLPDRIIAWLPSATAMGLAFVIPASTSIMMFLGAFAAWLFSYWAPGLAARFSLTIAAGLIAGESIVGVVAALAQLLAG
jgi:uncharacterized oligopeptide transporter (OPT) family protein